MKEYERVRYNFHEWLESIGGLVNATEKLLMWIVVFWSSRLFWLHIFDTQYGDGAAIKHVRKRGGGFKSVHGGQNTQEACDTPSLPELLQYQGI